MQTRTLTPSALFSSTDAAAGAAGAVRGRGVGDPNSILLAVCV
jgi:hypothetical protein